MGKSGEKRTTAAAEGGRPIRTAVRCGGRLECAAEREGLTALFSPLPLAEAGAPARPPHCEAALRQYVGARMVMNRVSPKSPRPRATPPVYRAMSLTEALCPPSYSSASRCSPSPFMVLVEVRLHCTPASVRTPLMNRGLLWR